MNNHFIDIHNTLKNIQIQKTTISSTQKKKKMNEIKSIIMKVKMTIQIKLQVNYRLQSVKITTF